MLRLRNPRQFQRRNGMTDPVDPEIPVEPEISALKEEVDRMRGEFVSLKERLARRLADGASAVADAVDNELSEGALAARLSALEKQFEAVAGRVKGTSKEAVHRLESEVSDRPLTSIALAFGVGLLAAQFLRR
jgi:ElaB/YqjD/DUF883 family membrane-anchored ribosome-binding protein